MSFSSSSQSKMRANAYPGHEKELEDAAKITAIAVMGVTGSGKSNFISKATNSDKVEIGHALTSCTQNTQSYEAIVNGRSVILFDTPGFDDTFRGDADILAELAETLNALYKNNVKLAGIIYLHRIKDVRMTNAIMRNLTMIRNLCGDDPLKNVILATSFWDEIPDITVGEMRERELKANFQYWGYMISKGSRVERFDNTRQGALDILMKLVNAPRVTLQIQEEMVNKGLSINQTAAGEALNIELTKMAAKHEEDLRRLKAEMDEAIRNRDAELQETLQIIQKEKEEQLNRMINEQESLRADRREEVRRLEQQYNDTVLRMVKENKEREAKMEALDKRLTDERADAHRRLQETLAKSDENMRRVTEAMRSARTQDRARYEEQLEKMEEQREESLAERRRWEEEMDQANERIRQLTIAQESAGDDVEERRYLEARIQELESNKRSSSDSFWNVVANVLSIGLPLLLSN